MEKQEIDFVRVIADDDFGIPGGMVRKGEPFKCTKGKAKELVGTGQAHYPTDDELDALDGKAAGSGGEGDPEKLAAARRATTSDSGKSEGDATASSGESKSEEKQGDAEKAGSGDNSAKSGGTKSTNATKASK